MSRPLRRTQMDGLMHATLVPKRGKRESPSLFVLQVHRCDGMLRVRDADNPEGPSTVEYVRDLARTYKVAC